MTGSSAGVGFAIPTRLVQNAVETLLRGETVQLPVLGISSKDESAVLQTVLPSGLADAAGLQAGDEILEVAGLPVETIAEVSAVVAAAKSGEQLPVKAKRGSVTRDFTITIP
jgi:putative serine protease PepD